ncbi:hypothetical protein QN277_009511 [Acacia crassicarpa]|uniref:SCP domain-containing protein n=1 Tax=Acacia crassicarpa TaxID=499986 RepID=A0AAE1INC7_9FABA|nr:hypothetical protein QN277_009511 [Acacia crassicarpa]
MEHFSSSKLPFFLLFFFLLTVWAYAQDSPQDYVDVHNAARGNVGVPPIVWDATVAEYAQNYANLRKADCQNRPSNGKYGETIHVFPGDMSGADAVKTWVAQKAYYDYNTNMCVGGECHSYLQVVWRNTIRLGCAKVRCNNGGTFIVCDYDPSGNIPGQRPY